MLDIAVDHRATEADLTASGLGYTIVRNSWYTENYASAISGALASGAVLGSAVWFLGLGYGAHRTHRLLSRPRSWQVLDALIGVVMLLLAVTLARTDLG